MENKWNMELSQKGWERLELYRVVDEEVFDLCIKAWDPLLEKFLGESSNLSVRALYLLTTQMNIIKGSILDLAHSLSLLPIYILYRSFLEHMFRAQYIAMRHAKEQDEEVGKDFFEFNLMKEEFELAKAYKKMGELLGAEAPSMTLWEFILQKYPNVTKAEIEDRSGNFGMKRMVTFFQDQEFEGKSLGEPIIGTLVEYAELSSCVHGSPMSYRNLAILKNPKEIEIKVLKHVHSAVSMTILIYNLINVIASTMDNKMIALFGKLDRAFEKLKE